jgi:hypothetical protein
LSVAEHGNDSCEEAIENEELASASELRTGPRRRAKPLLKRLFESLRVGA